MHVVDRDNYGFADFRQQLHLLRVGHAENRDALMFHFSVSDHASSRGASTSIFGCAAERGRWPGYNGLVPDCVLPAGCAAAAAKRQHEGGDFAGTGCDTIKSRPAKTSFCLHRGGRV